MKLPRTPYAPLAACESAGMAEELQDAIRHHLSGITNTRVAWGWKTTLSMLLLPFLHEQFPGLKAIHVVRNGLDMSYSDNQNMLAWSGDYILDAEERTWPAPVQSMLFWSRTNLAAARLVSTILARTIFESDSKTCAGTPPTRLRSSSGS